MTRMHGHAAAAGVCPSHFGIALDQREDRQGVLS
jgi:hypothetical protein